MEIGVIGLGKMGLNLALNLKEHHHKVQGLDVSSTAVSGVNSMEAILFYTIRKSSIRWSQERCIN